MTSGDVDTLGRVVRHHLLLATTGARRDPAVPGCADDVLAALDDGVALEVLGALTEADSRATGPTVWTRSRERAVAELVAVCRTRAAGPSAGVEAPSVEASRPHGAPDVVVVLRPSPTGGLHHLTLVVPGGARSLAVTAQVLAAHGLGIVEADVDLRPPGGVRATMTVTTGFGDPVDHRVLRQDLRRAVDGGLPAPLRVALDRHGDAAPAFAQAPPSVQATSRGAGSESSSGCAPRTGRVCSAGS